MDAPLYSVCAPVAKAFPNKYLMTFNMFKHVQSEVEMCLEKMFHP